MELDSFLAAPKWDILEILARRPSSPIEIAEMTKTTVSYVSQQLKLLEAMNLVEKKKTGAFSKGKPRSVYSIRDEFAYITVLEKGYAKKKKVQFDERKRFFLRVWMIDDDKVHLPLEKLFGEISESLEQISAILFDLNSKSVSLVVVSENKSLKTKLQSRAKIIGEKINFTFLNEQEALKLDSEKYHALYGPKFKLLSEGDNLKGGNDR